MYSLQPRVAGGVDINTIKIGPDTPKKILPFLSRQEATHRVQNGKSSLAVQSPQTIAKSALKQEHASTQEVLDISPISPMISTLIQAVRPNVILVMTADWSTSPIPCPASVWPPNHTTTTQIATYSEVQYTAHHARARKRLHQTPIMTLSEPSTMGLPLPPVDSIGLVVRKQSRAPPRARASWASVVRALVERILADPHFWSVGELDKRAVIYR